VKKQNDVITALLDDGEDYVIQKFAVPTKIENCITSFNIIENQTCTSYLFI